MDIALQCWVAIRSFAVVGRARLADEAGEGVISTAIAVLIIALLGAVMWTAFNELFTDVTDKARDAVDEIS